MKANCSTEGKDWDQRITLCCFLLENPSKEFLGFSLYIELVFG